jgi:DNA-binding NarL/FixJ family response regulator
VHRVIFSKTPHEITEAIHDVLNGEGAVTSSIARSAGPVPKTPSHSEKCSEGTGSINLLVTGHSYKMIAEKCGITLETVRSHIKRIYEKLRCILLRKCYESISDRRNQ